MPVLSVIIPVYKAEKFLVRCVESILTQSMSDLELILVDDGSPDKSGEICDSLAAADSRIIVLHQKNKGVSAARNAGLDLAAGRYISFVDADDAIAPGTYYAMLAKAEESSAEIIGCGVQYYSVDGKYMRSDLQKELDLGREQMLSALYDCPDPLGGSCCNKLFLADSISGLRYEEPVAMGEDWLFLFAAFERAKRLYKLPDPFYCVTEHPNSSARKANVEIPVKILRTSKKMRRLAKKHSVQLGRKATDKYLDDCLRYCRQIKKIGEQERQPYRGKLLYWKLSMVWTIFTAWVSRALQKNKLHGYIHGLLHI